MLIPAFIIDELLKEQARRQTSVLEELHIELDIPREIATNEKPEDKPQRSLEDVDFFL